MLELWLEAEGYSSVQVAKLMMKSTLMSLLCGKFWYWDSSGESFIEFKENGMGNLSRASMLRALSSRL